MSKEKRKLNNTNNSKNDQVETDEDVFENQFLSTPQLVWRSLKRHKLGITAMVILLLLYFFAIFADFFSPMQPLQQHLNYRFKGPDKIYTKDIVTGERVGMHVYLSERVRDPITFQSTFQNGTHFETLKVFDSVKGMEFSASLGEYNEYLQGDVNRFAYNIQERVVAFTKDGREIELTNSIRANRPLILLDYFNDEYLNGKAEKSSDGLFTTEFSKFLSGEEISINEDRRPMAFRDYLSIHSSKLQGAELEKVVTYRKLASILITAVDSSLEPDEVEIRSAHYQTLNSEILEMMKSDGLSVEEAFEFLGWFYSPEDLKGFVLTTPQNINGFTFNNYNIKFFVKSWEYKLLGFIPSSIHFFGTEKSLISDYANYDTKEGYISIWGTDMYGRDLFGRILMGSRVSLSIGLIGIMITFTIGLLLGGTAGYFGGWIDEILMRMTEILMSIPSFYLLVSLAAVLPRQLDPSIRYILIIVILSFISWPGMTRVIRGMTLGIKRTEFIEAAVALGYPPRRIIAKHLLPNTATYVIVSATLSIPSYILGEAGLSFLGIGITEPSASWGLMLAQAQSIEALTNYPWLLLPGLFIFLTVLSYNLFGDAVRDALDPRGLGH